MATRTRHRWVERDNKPVLQWREEGGYVDRPWEDVPTEIETEEDKIKTKEREDLIADGKRRK